MSRGSSCGHLVQRGLDDLARQVVGTHVLQRALERAADRRAGGGDDDGFGHGRAPRVDGAGRTRSLGGGPRVLTAYGDAGRGAASGVGRRHRRRQPRPATACWWTRRRSSRAQRPGARGRAARPVPRDLGAGLADGVAAAHGDRAGPLAADGSGRLRSVSQAQRGAAEGSKARRRPHSPRAEGWNRSSLNMSCSPANARPEHAAERHGAAAGLDHGDGLRGGQVAAGAAGRTSAAAGRSDLMCPGRGRSRRRPRSRVAQVRHGAGQVRAPTRRAGSGG